MKPVFILMLKACNPNTGKSTVFNALTGLRQHTGNWPGKTVTRAEGGFEYNKQKYKLVDLPGTYSLLSTSEDETAARDFILFGKPNVTVIVVDANRLERIKNVPDNIEKAVKTLSTEIEKEFPNIENSRWIAFRLLEGDNQVIEALRTGELV